MLGRPARPARPIPVPVRIKSLANHDRRCCVACDPRRREMDGSIDGEPWRHPRRAGRRNSGGVEAYSGDACAGVRRLCCFATLAECGQGNAIVGMVQRTRMEPRPPTPWRGRRLVAPQDNQRIDVTRPRRERKFAIGTRVLCITR
jgi:hypothetical protein